MTTVNMDVSYHYFNFFFLDGKNLASCYLYLPTYIANFKNLNRHGLITLSM